MTVPTVHCEAILRAVSKKRDKGGDWAQVVLQIQPDEIPPALWTVPLGSRWMVAFAQIGDDELPVTHEPKKMKAKTPFGDMKRSQQAGMMCADRIFQTWLTDITFCTAENEVARGIEITARILRARLSVDSRAELATDEAAGKRWDELYTQFLKETDGMAEER